MGPGWGERALPSLKPHSRAPIPHPSRAAGSGLDGFSRILTQPPLPNSPRGPRPAEQLGREGIFHRGEASLQLSRALPGGGGDALESGGQGEGGGAGEGVGVSRKGNLGPIKPPSPPRVPAENAAPAQKLTRPLPGG